MSWLAGRCDAGRGGRVDDLPDGTQATSSAEAALAAVCDQLETLRQIAPLDGATLKTLYAIEAKAREALSADVTARDYRIVESRCGWEVLDPSGCWSARYSQNHPDPQGAAEAEAARLNAGGDEDDLHVRAIEYRLERDEARAEADRYRRALDRIAVYDVPGTGVYRNTDAAEFARRVLDGGEA